MLAGERNVSLGVSPSLGLSFSWKWFGKTCLSSSNTARNTFPPCLPCLTASVSVPEHGAGRAGEDGRAREDHRLGQEEAGAHAKVQPAARARGALINITKTCLFGAAFLGHSRTKSILERLNPLARSEVAAKDSPVSDSEQKKVLARLSNADGALIKFLLPLSLNRTLTTSVFPSPLPRKGTLYRSAN